MSRQYGEHGRYVVPGVARRGWDGDSPQNKTRQVLKKLDRNWEDEHTDAPPEPNTYPEIDGYPDPPPQRRKRRTRRRPDQSIRWSQRGGYRMADRYPFPYSQPKERRVLKAVLQSDDATESV